MNTYAAQIIGNFWLASSDEFPEAMFIALGLAALGVVFAIIGGLIDRPVLASVGFVWALAVGMIGGYISMTDSNNEMIELREARVKHLASYGVEVTKSHWSDLELPVYKPEGDAKFGLAQALVDGKVSTVRLEMTDGELKVYSTVGEELKQLEAKK